MSTYKLILAPEGSLIPDDLLHKVVTPSKNIIERIVQCKDEEKIVQVTTTEIQLLVEYRHILDVNLRAIIGLQGSTYNTIWNTYVSAMERTTIDNLRAEEQEANNERSDAGNEKLVSFTPDQRRPAGRLRIAEPANPSTEEEEEIGDIE